MWQDAAACRDHIALFDRAGDRPSDPTARAEATAVCARCPVWTLCLADAMTTADPGFRAGTTAFRRTLHGAPPYRIRTDYAV